MPYKARSINGAQARVRNLEKQVAYLDKWAGELVQERRILAKLAAEGPAFFNPLDAFAAKTLRDKILERECRLNPDGSPMEQP